MKKMIIVTMEQVAVEANLRPGKASDMPWRGYVADRFMKDHGCVVTDFTKLRYLSDGNGRDEMHVVGVCGESISYPQK